MAFIPEAKTNGAVGEPPTAHRPYGIDTSTAGTIQERYFMVLAGLMQKSFEVNREILDQLIMLNASLAPKVTEINAGHKTPEREFEYPPSDGVPMSRQGKRSR